MVCKRENSKKSRPPHQNSGTTVWKSVLVGSSHCFFYFFFVGYDYLDAVFQRFCNRFQRHACHGACFSDYLLACERYVDEACADVRIFRCAQVKHIVHDTVAYVGACGEGYVARKAVFADVLNHCFATVFRFCSFVISAVNLNRFMHAPPKSLSFTHML